MRVKGGAQGGGGRRRTCPKPILHVLYLSVQKQILEKLLSSTGILNNDNEDTIGWLSEKRVAYEYWSNGTRALCKRVVSKDREEQDRG